MTSRGLHLAVALDGAGWHPAAWRRPDAHPDRLFTAPYWTGLVQTAERGLLDFVTFEDSFGMQGARRPGPDHHVDQVRGRLDAAQTASLVAPVTTHIGLIPTITTVHTEPFHVSTAIATLDYLSEGRAGWRPQLSARPDEAAHFGRRDLSATTSEELFDEAADVVEVVRRLWDSWEEGAEIRDVATGRFIDRDRLHYIDFEGRWFSVKGPSITPRPIQGHPVIAALAHSEVPYRFAARAADVVFVTPQSLDEVEPLTAQVRSAEAAVGRSGAPLQIWGELVVFLGADQRAAEAAKDRLDQWLGRPYRSDAAVYTGDPAGLVDLLEAGHRAGLAGFRLRPAALPGDLDLIVEQVVPGLQARGRFRPAYVEANLRARLGLAPAPNRYGAPA